MPALSPTMEKGNLVKWHKKEGDAVKSGDVIAEIETDKATMEVEAVDEGTIGKILVPEGSNDVAVNTPIATIVAEGEDANPRRQKQRQSPISPPSSRRARSPQPPAASKSRPKRPKRRHRRNPAPSSRRPCRQVPSPRFQKAPSWSP